MENMITTREAAKILGVTIRRVRAMMGSGLLPGMIKLGRDWFLNEQEVRNLAARERPAHRPRGIKNA